MVTNLLSIEVGARIGSTGKIKKGNTVKGFIVEWFEGCWLTWGFSDPSRTLVVENALILETKEDAEKYLERAKKRNPHRSFDGAKVIPNPTSNPIEEKETEYCYWCGADIEDTVVHDGEHYCSNKCSRWQIPSLREWAFRRFL
ncbi:hypothetical protein [Vibrio crassostreae]|uniref:hypothetical protein n=1 Tax=Vibrio crassostreae TaxID=246167 RepID=UPI001B304CCF|nr:hypothetical protein [Vibrio crassostreae]